MLIWQHFRIGEENRSYKKRELKKKSSQLIYTELLTMYIVAAFCDVIIQLDIKMMSFCNTITSCSIHFGHRCAKILHPIRKWDVPLVRNFSELLWPRHRSQTFVLSKRLWVARTSWRSERKWDQGWAERTPSDQILLQRSSLSSTTFHILWRQTICIMTARANG